MSGTDEVRLVVPARPEFLRLARVAAAGLAGRLGFSYDEIEDLRLAIDELCFGLTGPTGRHGTVEIVYTIRPGELEVSGEGSFLEDISPVGLTELSRVILGALVDEHDLTDGADRQDGAATGDRADLPRSGTAGTGPAGPRFRLVKRHRPEAPVDGR